MAAEGNVIVNILAQSIVQHPAFQETINSILTATNQEKTTNTVNVETYQINRNNSTNITSAGSANNSIRNVGTNRQFRFGTPVNELSSTFRRREGSKKSSVIQFQRDVNYTPRRRSTPYQKRVGRPAAAATSTRNVNTEFSEQRK